MKICAEDTSELFLAGSLSADEIVAFEDHLETCAYCRRRLERAAGSEDVWQSARELLSIEIPRTLTEMTPVDSSINRSSVDSDWLPTCTTAAVLSILGPTDDPEYVGRIGTYEISGVVGRGSAGIVLRGFDRSLHRNVAIKILDPTIAGVNAARQRFAREARAMAAISHENVVPIFEVNEHVGLPFFVMEYVPGGSLDRRLQSEGSFDVASVVRIGLQIAQALSIAHVQGLVHRDIKPGNILMDRGTDRVRVADFGLVRVSNDVSCTRSGFIAGTPQYMSPEQVKGEVCDGRSDLFSLGSLMYTLCTGHSPFKAETVYGVMQRIVHDSPPSIRQLNPQVPEWLEEFIFRLMSKQRTDRVPRATDVVLILQAELAYLQNPATQRNVYHRSLVQVFRNRLKTVERRGKILAGVLLATLTLIVFGTSVLQFGSPNNADGNIAQKPDESTSATFPTSHAVLWDADDIKATQSAATRFEEAMRQPTDRSATDPWDTQSAEIHRRLNSLSIELEGKITPRVNELSDNQTPLPKPLPVQNE